MHSTSLVVRMWWEPGWGLRASVRGLQGQETVYFKSLADLGQYLDQQALRLKKEREPPGEFIEAGS